MASTPSNILQCETGFSVVGLLDGEHYLAPVRLLVTIIVTSVLSGWTPDKIRRLKLFFSHWLSGVALCLLYTMENMMITVCWAGNNLEGLIKFIKYMQLASSNMLAITNLAICINLAIIVMCHRTMTRVRGVSSTGTLLLFLIFSMAVSLPTVFYWKSVVVLGTGFWCSNPDAGGKDFINVSIFYVEFFVGVVMFVIVVYLLMFQMKTVKECWKIHARIRYYFGLTLLGMGVNLGLGVCGTIFVTTDYSKPLLLIWSWLFRYIHIALDTVVLYGVLRESNMDERIAASRCASNNLIRTSSKPASDGEARTVSRRGGNYNYPRKTTDGAPQA